MNTQKILATVSVLMLITATLGVAGAQTGVREDIKNKRVVHKYNVVHYQIERHRIGMEAIISFVNGLGNDSTKISAIKDQLVALDGTLKSLADSGNSTGFQVKLDEMKNKVTEFRTEARAVLGTNVGKAQEKVAAAIEANKAYLESLVQDINEARTEAELEVLDEANNASQGKVDKFKETGANVTALQAKLDDIKAKRTLLKEKMDVAITSCGNTSFAKCNTTEAQAYRALKEEIKQMYRELRDIARQTGRSHKVANAIDAAKKVIERTRERITRAEQQGRDVTVDSAKLDEVNSIIAGAESKYNSGDYEGAIEELAAAREAYKSAAKESRERIAEEKNTTAEERKTTAGKTANRTGGKR